jgi:hypothetical protein
MQKRTYRTIKAGTMNDHENVCLDFSDWEMIKTLSIAVENESFVPSLSLKDGVIRSLYKNKKLLGKVPRIIPARDDRPK